MELVAPLQKNRVFIVAEIGKNFIVEENAQSIELCLENAKALVLAAKENGADAVKFQTHSVEDEVYKMEFDSPHFKGKSRYEWVKRNTESTPLETFWKPLKAYCDEIGIVFFSTPMSRGAAYIVSELNTPIWKIASSDVLDFVLLDYLCSTKKPIIVPTGMSTTEEIDTSVAFLQKKQATFVLLHAISQYPYPKESSNLRTIEFLKKRYQDISVGFSQNSPWIEPAVAAAALGIVVLEQHFTFDREAFGPDHKVSMIPEEFKDMVSQIRDLEAHPEKRENILRDAAPYLGTEEKLMQDGEKAFRPLFRKALVAAQDIPAGTKITPDMIYAMRPQEYIGGIESEYYEVVVGKKAVEDIAKFTPFTPKILAE